MYMYESYMYCTFGASDAVLITNVFNSLFPCYNSGYIQYILLFNSGTCTPATFKGKALTQFSFKFYDEVTNIQNHFTSFCRPTTIVLYLVTW